LEKCDPKTEEVKAVIERETPIQNHYHELWPSSFHRDGALEKAIKFL